MANEKRLIDANLVKSSVQEAMAEYSSEELFIKVAKLICQLLDRAPTVDAVEVIRCKDCKYCRTFFPIKEIGKEAIQVWFCDLYRCNRKTDEFCSDGERRAD